MKRITWSSVSRRSLVCIVVLQLFQNELITDDIDLAVVEGRALVREVDDAPAVENRVEDAVIGDLRCERIDLGDRAAHRLMQRRRHDPGTDARVRGMEIEQALSKHHSSSPVQLTSSIPYQSTAAL